MADWDKHAAIMLVGVAGFQVWDAWNKNAPTLQDVRKAPPGDDSIRQHMLDAEITVGSLAVILGLVFAVLTKDATALIVMVGIFTALVALHHWILASDVI